MTVENGIYVVHAATEQSSVSVATDDPADALKRARELEEMGRAVTITDRDGNRHTVAELEANILSGKYARPASSERL